MDGTLYKYHIGRKSLRFYKTSVLIIETVYKLYIKIQLQSHREQPFRHYKDVSDKAL
jgi:hypothetical protein